MICSRLPPNTNETPLSACQFADEELVCAREPDTVIYWRIPI